MTPVEHCGAYPPSISGAPTTDLHRECVLRPGHQGSHANEEGCRWLFIGTPDSE